MIYTNLYIGKNVSKVLLICQIQLAALKM